MNIIKSNYHNFSVRRAFIPLLIAGILIFSCCSTNNSSQEKRQKKTSATIEKAFTLSSPEKGMVIRHGENFDISLVAKNNQNLDSIKLVQDDKAIPTTQISDLKYNCSLLSEMVGTHLYKLTAYYSDSLSETHTLKLFVLPNTTPSAINYKVVRSFDHDPKAYTQGLLYKDGYLYESTGKKKQSTIRKIDLTTGEVVRKKSIDPELFGEGIAVVGKEIYMITYISQVGLVFDAVNFDVIRRFDLQTKEGWGLTTYDNQLLLSDGTATLYFFNPEYFTLDKQIEVCDNKGLVNKINELEYTKYGLFANVYGKKHIVLIDPETGVVKGTLDLSALFPENVPDDFEHVLNGIAYNPEANTFYVTGKQWPVIYEITLSID